MAARATSCPPAVHPAAASEAAPSSSAGIDSNITTANGNAVAAVRTLNLPILQAESPRALAVRAEQLPEKASAVLQALAEQSRVRGINLMSGRSIIWGRMVNHEAALGYTRGQETTVACVSCKRQAGPFVKCVVVQGKLSGACTNCHYGSGGRRCGFRQHTSTGSAIAPTRGFHHTRACRKTIAKTHRAQPYHKIARLYRKLAEVFEELAENGEEVETVKMEDGSDEEIEE
ncbi:MAG: hypothetical protein M1813_001247 [Trichoglossum hirsutum]|nr:MAG: hypothetical protein M1813_001247 [Trichoglossum hirsutum]